MVAPIKTRLLQRLIITSFVISVVAVIVGTIYSTWDFKRNQDREAHRAMSEFAAAQLPALAYAASQHDLPAIHAQLNGALRLRNVYTAAWLPADQSPPIEVSRPRIPTLIQQDFPLVATIANQSIQVGTYRLGISADHGVDIWPLAVKVLVQGLVLALLALLGVSLLLQRTIFKHLRRLRDLISRDTLPGSTYSLDREFGSQDDFDDLVEALNRRESNSRNLLFEERLIRKQLLHRQTHLDRLLHMVSLEMRGALFTLAGFISELQLELRTQSIAEKSEIAQLFTHLEKAKSRIAHHTSRFAHLLQIRNSEQLPRVLGSQEVHAVVHKALEQIILDSRKPDMQISVEGTCLADENQLHEIFSELFRNSYRHHKGPAPMKWQLQGLVTGSTCEFRFEDNGPGISSELLHKIDTFCCTDRHHPDMGIGIPICRLLAESMDGELLLEKIPAGGLRTIIRLPRGG